MAAPSLLLADEDSRREIVTAVRRLDPDIDIVTVHDLDLSSASDPQILDAAYTAGRILISHDVNTMRAFAEERIQSDQGIAGLFLVSQNRATADVAESLKLVATLSEADEWKNRIVYLPL